MANRLPVDLERLPDGTRAVEAQPRRAGHGAGADPAQPRGRVGRLAGRAGRRGRTVRRGRSDAASGASCRRRRSRDYYEGFSNGTLWPLYHDVVRAARVRPRTGGRPTREVNQRFADDGREGRRAGRHRVGAGLPAAAACRRCCARCGPTCASGSSCTSRSRRSSCSCSCRGAREIVRGPARRRPRRLPDAGRRAQLPLARRSALGLAVGAQRRADLAGTVRLATACASARSPSRSTADASTSSSRSRGGAASGPSRSAPTSAIPAGSSARRRPARLHQGHRRAAARRSQELLVEGRVDPATTVMVQLATPEPGARRALPADARRDRAGRRADQRRVRQGRARPVCTTCTSRSTAEELVAFFTRGRRHARDAAARRHEPGLQGVRGLPVRRRRRAGAQRVRRRGDRAARARSS